MFNQVLTAFFFSIEGFTAPSCEKMVDACRSPVRVLVAVVRNDPRADASFPHPFGNLRVAPGGGRAHFCKNTYRTPRRATTSQAPIDRLVLD